MVVLWFILLTVAILLSYLLKKKYTFWKDKNVPSLPPTPFLGNYGPYILQKRPMFEVVQDMCMKLPKEPLIGAYIGTKPVLIAQDLEYLKLILAKDYYYFNGRDLSEYSDREVLTRNLFFTYGDHWRVLRQNFSPIFSPAKMKAMFPLVALKGKEFEKLISLEYDNSQVISVRTMCARFTMDVICSCVFGVEGKVMTTEENVENNVFRQIADAIFESSTLKAFKFAVRSIYPWLLYGSGVTVFPDMIHIFFGKVMMDVIKSRNGEPSPRKDIIDIMMGFRKMPYITGDSIENYKNKSKKTVNIKVDDELLIAQCVVFFGAGFETSALTMALTLYNLAKHPEVQEKVLQEVDEYLKKTGGIEYSCVTDLTYLDQCVNETLRLYPAVGVTTREVYEDYTFPNGVTVEKGLLVHIPINHLHNSPEFWPEPEEFRPERFSPQNQSKIRPYTYMPFGEGPRMCIGMQFGKMQIMAGLITILKQYRVDRTDETVEKIIFDPKCVVINACVSDVKLRFLARRQI